MQLTKPFQITGASGFARVCASDDLNAPLLDLDSKEINLDAAFFALFQNRVRRASRYVKFANLAAHKCLESLAHPMMAGKTVGLYLGTGIGNSPDIVGFTAEIFENHATTVSPAAFVNTVSNAGLFYAARAVGVECTTTVVSQETLSFECALLSAARALQAGEIEIALVGGVDVYHPPRLTMFERLNSRGARPESLGEGAAFITLVKDSDSSLPNLGYLQAIKVERVENATTLLDWMGTHHQCISPLTGYLGAGVDLSENEFLELSHQLRLTPYQTKCLAGDYSTASAYSVAKFLSEENSVQHHKLTHINRHYEGLSGLIQISRQLSD